METLNERLCSIISLLNIFNQNQITKHKCQRLSVDVNDKCFIHKVMILLGTFSVFPTTYINIFACTKN